MNIRELTLKGAFILELNLSEDNRGSFIKTFSSDLFENTPLNKFNVAEEFITVSKKNVIRGMHFQLPPHDHNKLVFCSRGSVIDVLVDLRSDSSTYGNVQAVNLDSKSKCAVFIPIGFAHGFLSLEDGSELIYKVDKCYAATHDTGILWSSIRYDWNIKDPIISERDNSFIKFKDFVTPFN